MGWASLFRDCSLASDGGRDEFCTLAASFARSDPDASTALAVTPPASRNLRREIMKPPWFENAIPSLYVRRRIGDCGLNLDRAYFQWWSPASSALPAESGTRHRWMNPPDAVRAT